LVRWAGTQQQQHQQRQAERRLKCEIAMDFYVSLFFCWLYAFFFIPSAISPSQHSQSVGVAFVGDLYLLRYNIYRGRLVL